MNKKNVKKGLLFVLCMALVSVVSIVGTMAVLSKQTGPIVNTFQPENTLAETFTLTETAEGGEQATTVGRTFSGVVPNQVITGKDPTITFSTLKAEAFLFVEILDTNNIIKVSSEDDTRVGDLYSYAIDDGEDWIELTGVAGAQGGKVWYQKVAKGTADAVNILKNQTVTINDYVEENVVGNASMSIYAYLCQTVGFAGANELAQATAAYGTFKA